MKTAASIAFRFLFFNKWQTLFIALGIAVGVAVQMFVGLLIDSLQSGLIERTVGSSPHVIVRPAEEGEYIKQPERIISAVNNIDEITLTDIVAEKSAFVITQNDSYPVLFKGLSRDTDDLFQIKKNIESGKYLRGSTEVVIGKELSDEDGIKTGDTIEIGDGSGNRGNFRVSGIFKTGVSQIDKSWVVGEIGAARNFFGLGKDATSIAIQVKDVFAADSVRDEVVNLVRDNDLEIASWKDENRQLLTALSSQSSSSFMIQFFVLMSVTIAIASILSILVMQKSRQIGILKAMGLTDRDTSTVFLTMSAFLGIVGSTFGTALGFLLFFGFVNGPKTPDGERLFEPNIRWIFVAATWFITIVSAMIAGIIPARRSAKLSPIDIIQNG